jgi:hypothetical protein
MEDSTPVTRVLSARGIPHRLFRHPGQVHSLEQAAQERGQKPEQVVRSLVFRLGQGQYVMILVAGPGQVAWPALRSYLGQSRLTMATAEEVQALRKSRLPPATRPGRFRRSACRPHCGSWSTRAYCSKRKYRSDQASAIRPYF